MSQERKPSAPDYLTLQIQGLPDIYPRVTTDSLIKPETPTLQDRIWLTTRRALELLTATGEPFSWNDKYYLFLY